MFLRITMVCYIFKGVLGMARYIIYFFILSFLFLGCSRYDAKTPDTQANRKGFAHIIGFSPTSDVTEIYFYADEMGFEPLYCLAFQSSPKNVKKSSKNLTLKKTIILIGKNLLLFQKTFFGGTLKNGKNLSSILHKWNKQKRHIIFGIIPKTQNANL